MKQLTKSEIEQVHGAGLFYDLGRFFAQVGNANDRIHAQYGNTNKNHWYRY